MGLRREFSGMVMAITSPHLRIDQGVFPYFMAKFLVFNKVKKTVFGDSIRFCVGGGASLDIKQQQFFAALGVPVYQGYGLTEAAPIILRILPEFTNSELQA